MGCYLRNSHGTETESGSVSPLETRSVGGEVNERSDDPSRISCHKNEAHREDSLVRWTEVVTAPGDRVGNTRTDGADAEDEGEIGDCRFLDWIDDAEDDESARHLSALIKHRSSETSFE